jgi:hypothetical protein
MHGSRIVAQKWTPVALIVHYREKVLLAILLVNSGGDKNG